MYPGPPSLLMNFHLRNAADKDIPQLRDLIDASVRGLQSADYTPAQIEQSLKTVYGVDSQLIADQTYFVVEAESGEIVGCGGWSKRRTLFGGDQYAAREDSLLDPRKEPAKIRAFFVRPAFARRGIGTLILQACEAAAAAAGFSRLEMGSTLSGVPFYQAHGYSPLESLNVTLGNGEVLPIVRMAKQL
jgi:GNAT superfamily N-acetyltransferase